MKRIYSTLLAGLTALSLSCGEETTVAPECIDSTECRGQRLCLEEKCVDYQQACGIDTNAECNEDTTLEGVYALAKSDCSLIIQGAGISGVEFYDAPATDLEKPCKRFQTYWRSGTDVYCLDNYEFADDQPLANGNYLVMPANAVTSNPLEITRCGQNILLQWDNKQCSALFEKTESEPEWYDFCR